MKTTSSTPTLAFLLPRAQAWRTTGGGRHAKYKRRATAIAHHERVPTQGGSCHHRHLRRTVRGRGAQGRCNSLYTTIGEQLASPLPASSSSSSLSHNNVFGASLQVLVFFFLPSSSSARPLLLPPDTTLFSSLSIRSLSLSLPPHSSLRAVVTMCCCRWWLAAQFFLSFLGRYFFSASLSSALFWRRKTSLTGAILPSTLMRL